MSENSNGGSGYQPPPRKKVALDNNKIYLYTPNQQGKRASLQFQLIKNNPRLVIYTNDPDDTIGYGKIIGAMSLPNFYVMLGLMRQAAMATGKFREKIDNRGYTFAGGKRSESMQVLSSTIVGRDEDGTVWITVSAPRRPNLKFVFGPDEYHSYTHSDGTPWSKPELSQQFALTYAEMLGQIMSNLAVTEYVPPDPPKDRNGGGGGGQRQATRQQSEVADDDIPW